MPSPQPQGSQPARSLVSMLRDEGSFLRQWLDNPLTTGAITPSGPELAAAMARAVDVRTPGTVLELGPGTGVVTAALLKHGITAERLMAIEYSGRFARLLQARYPDARIVEGDAYALDLYLGERDVPLAGVVSSLPLLTKPHEQRRELIVKALDRITPGGGFVQFSYGLGPPVRPEPGLFTVEKSGWIVRNVPPARVWVYRKALS